MHEHHHHFKYDPAQRMKILNPEDILKAIGLKEGMCFVDLGCNDGYFTLPAAKIVGDRGKVIALDIDEEALNRLSQKIKQNKITNTTILHSAAEKSLPYKNIADVIFFGTVLHDFNDPIKVLKNSKKMLKKDGIIYNLDWQKTRSEIGPPFEIRLSIDDVRKLADEADLKLESSKNISDLFYEVILKN